MKATYLGKRSVSLTDDKTGELIEGTSIYYAYADANVDGQASGKFFIRSGSPVELPVGIKPNDSINIEFNQYGKVCEVFK